MGLLHRLRGDEALMELYAGGDVHAFNELYSRHKDQLFGFLSSSTGDHSSAEELAQETWTAIIRQASNYQPTAKFSTYLYTVARRKLIDQHRRISSRPSADASSEEVMAPADTEPEAQAAVTGILIAITALPREQQEAFILKEEGLSLTDIALIAEVGEETIKSRLRYARRTLRQQLSGGDEQDVRSR